MTLSAPAAADTQTITDYFSVHADGEARSVDHSVWDKLLTEHVIASKDGVNRVDYTGWQGAGHNPLKAYINHPRGISIEGSKVKASSIYQWYQADFGGDEAGVLAHARKYTNDALKAKLDGKTSIEGYGYDWSLNNIQRGS